MVLQDRAIIERLLEPDLDKRIVITPLVDPKVQIGPSSVDVRLGSSFKVPTTSRVGSIDPDKEELVTTYYTTVTIGHQDDFFLHGRICTRRHYGIRSCPARSGMPYRRPQFLGTPWTPGPRQLRGLSTLDIPETSRSSSSTPDDSRSSLNQPCAWPSSVSWSSKTFR